MQLSHLAQLIGAHVEGDDVCVSSAVIDSRRVCGGELFVALKGERIDGHECVDHAKQQGASAALLERAVACEIPQIISRDARLSLGAMGRAWREIFTGPLVAITGSNGKTTIKEMLASILSLSGRCLHTEGNYNNELGVPLTLSRLEHDHDYAVIEMGASHAGEIQRLTDMAQPTIGVISNVSAAHLSGFGSIEGIAHAKGELFTSMPDDSLVVVNADDSFASMWSGLAGKRVLRTFGYHRDADVSIRSGLHANSHRFYFKRPARYLDFEPSLPGKHNLLNAAAAALVADYLGVEHATIKQGLMEMTPAPGRLEFKLGSGGIEIIDDTYNANPASLAAALGVLSEQVGEKWLVLGDMGELGDDASSIHNKAGQAALDHGVDRLFTLGTVSEQASASFGSAAMHFHDRDDLVKELTRIRRKGIVCLVKGSRCMAMETIVSALLSLASQ